MQIFAQFFFAGLGGTIAGLLIGYAMGPRVYQRALGSIDELFEITDNLSKRLRQQTARTSAERSVESRLSDRELKDEANKRLSGEKPTAVTSINQSFGNYQK